MTTYILDFGALFKFDMDYSALTMKTVLMVLCLGLICLVNNERCEVNAGDAVCTTESKASTYETTQSHKSRKLLSADKKTKDKKPQVDLKRISAEFDKYYACLKKKLQTHNSGVIPIEAELYQEGMSATLTCEIW